MRKRFTFNTARGQVCCAADDPALLCSQCRRQAALATTKRGHKLRVASPKAPKPYTEAIKARQGGSNDIAVVTTKSGAPLPYSTALKRRTSAAR